MDETKIREIIEQVDPNGDMPDSLKEELILALTEYSDIEEMDYTSTEYDQPAVSIDWRVNAANSARNIAKDLNIL